MTVDCTLTHAFFSNPKSLELARRCHSVVQIDCTYKTNIYNMPLAHIIGISPFFTTFTIGFAFIPKEETCDYEWVLTILKEALNGNCPNFIVTDKEDALISASRTVFPLAKSILCRWHINKNVLVKASGVIHDGDTRDGLLYAWARLRF
jgi:hypothetical protein